MSQKDTFAEEAKGAGRAVGHLIAIVLGLVLIVVAAAMGVTLVLLPVAVLAGIAGLMLISWGLYIKSQTPQDKNRV